MEVCIAGVDGFSLVIAAGPYSTSDNILYEPLTDLKSCLDSDSAPDVCILVCTAISLHHHCDITGYYLAIRNIGRDAKFTVAFFFHSVRLQISQPGLHRSP